MRIAAYQFAVSGDIEFNFYEIKKAINDAKEKNAQLVIFPECSLTGYPPRDISNSSIVNFELVGKICANLQVLSDEQNISFIIGTIYRHKGQIFNRAILFQPKQQQSVYDKRALWGWDKENFVSGDRKGVFHIGDITVGIRICFEVRFPEYFRELYMERTDINIVLFYDVSDSDDVERYNLLKAHLQTRAVENATTIISVNAVNPFQTAPTAVFGKSGQICKECTRNTTELMIYDFEKKDDNFGERGRKEVSDRLLFG